MGGTIIIYIVVGYFIIYLALAVFDAVKKSISSTKSKALEKAEQLNWLNNIEPKHRNLHTYPEDWGMRRKFIAERENYTCKMCGRKGWLGFHIHHITPLSKGGDNSLDNLTYLCKRCHENQHPHMLEARELKQKEYAKSRNAAYWKMYWARKKTSK